MSLNNYMAPENRKRQKVYTRLGLLYRSSRPDVFCKKDVLRNFGKFTGKHLCQNLYFNQVAGLTCNFIKIETLTQVFSCEFSAKVWKVSVEYTITWKIKSSTSSLNLCATNKLAQKSFSQKFLRNHFLVLVLTFLKWILLRYFAVIFSLLPARYF